MRFYAVAGLNTGFGYSVYALLIFLGTNVYIAQVVARSAGMTFNYWSYSSLVFRSRRLDIPRFVVTYGLSYVFALSVMAAILQVVANR